MAEQPFDAKKISDAMRSQMRKVVLAATELVRKEAIRLVLQTPKSGRMRHGHKASSPGEPWASDTGFALSTITAEVDEAKLTGTVRIGAEYGPYLEFGTQTMEPRPVLRPALVNTQQQVQELLRKAGRDGLASVVVK